MMDHVTGFINTAAFHLFLLDLSGDSGLGLVHNVLVIRGNKPYSWSGSVTWFIACLHTLMLLTISISALCVPHLVIYPTLKQLK